MGRFSSTAVLAVLLLNGLVIIGAYGVDILKTSGFSSCEQNSTVTVDRFNVQYNRADNTVTFDVSGSSTKTQNVTASLSVTAYGKQVYQRTFDPCDTAAKVDQLCPVPVGTFAAKGVQPIPAEYASLIPEIAFQIPDLDGQAKLELKSVGGDHKDLACIQSLVNNGKSTVVPAVSYLAVGITGAALVFSGVSALGAVGAGAGAAASSAGGTASPSPTFTEVFGWMQSMAMNGMLSVNYPPVYRSFSRNFAFSGGLIQWTQMQTSIDSFRKVTGGNLTTDSVAYLKNSTLVYDTSSGSGDLRKRGSQMSDHVLHLIARALTASVNGSELAVGGRNGSSSNGTNSTQAGGSKASRTVHGIQAFVEQLAIPQSNTFMTVLLIFAIAIVAVAVGILLFKLILELWALCGSFPQSLTGFRKRYWGLLGRTIVNMILVLYGIWTLYCIFEFTHGDSWAGKVLAGVTLAAFTAILGFFTFRIWRLARRLKKNEGDTSALYEDKEMWLKYSLFYDQYKRDLWWLFVPTIFYMFARGCIIAAGNGHGMVQTIAQLVVESLMLILLLWSRPFETKSGIWINMVIQVVRVLSVICILVFVERLGISQTTKTVTGVVLIVMQSVLTAALAILIAVNGILVCVRQNPHRKRRKEAEKMKYDPDNLTPLDPRNSLLMEPRKGDLFMQKDRFGTGYLTDQDGGGLAQYHTYAIEERSRPSHGRRSYSNEPLVQSATGLTYPPPPPPPPSSSFDHSPPRFVPLHDQGLDEPSPYRRQPTIPNVAYR